MPTLDERVAYVEGRVNEQSQQIGGIREAIVSLEARIDRRLEGIEGRLTGLDQRFQWLVGIQLSTLIAVIAALLAR